MQCIKNYLQDYKDAHKKWLEHQQETIIFMKENGDCLANLRWHVRNTNFAGSTAGFVSTAFGIAALATMWFPPISLGLGITSCAVGLSGFIMNIGKIMEGNYYNQCPGPYAASWIITNTVLYSLKKMTCLCVKPSLCYQLE